MTETGCDNDIAVLLFINNAVRIVDAAAPPSTQITF
jgi:hypothetical protein